MSDKGGIWLFLPDLRPGGAQRAVLNLIEGFAAHGVLARVVVAGGAGELAPIFRGQCHVVDLKCPSTLASVPRLARWLREVQPDALLSHLSHANVAALCARWLSGEPVPILVTEHTLWLEGDERTLRQRATLALMRLLYSRADRVVAVSLNAARQLRKILRRPGLDVRVIRQAALSRRLPSLAEMPCDHPWFRGQGPPVVLAAGRLHRVKNYHLSLAAFAHLRTKSDTKLVILGTGPESGSLKKAAREWGIAEHVDMPGFIPNPYPWIRQANVILLTSQKEALPTVLVEALALGTPFVAVDCPYGPRELVEISGTGWLVSSANPRYIADAILRVMALPRPTPTWLECFEASHVAHQYLQLIA